MDRQELNRLIQDRLSVMDTESVELIEEGEDSYVLKVVSKDFADVSVLRRIRMIYPLLESFLASSEVHLEINPLSIEEEQGDFDTSNAPRSKSNSNPGLAANP